MSQVHHPFALRLGVDTELAATGTAHLEFVEPSCAGRLESNRPRRSALWPAHPPRPMTAAIRSKGYRRNVD